MWNTILETLRSEFSDAPDVEQVTRILTRLLLPALLSTLLALAVLAALPRLVGRDKG